jgi:glycosyltransferase involved in cell wall biosynthesis
MKICFAYGDYPSSRGASGVATFLQILARNLAKRGHDVLVMANRQTSEPAFDEDHGVQVLWMPRTSLHWYFLKTPIVGPKFVARELELSWQMFHHVRRLHDQWHFDIIEGTETGSLFLRSLDSVPLCIRLHADEYTYLKYTYGYRLGLREKALRKLQRMALKRAHVLISPSRAHAREIEKELKDRCPQIFHVPNPLTSDRFASSCSSHQDNGPHTQSVVLMVSRLQRHKGVDILLRSIPYVCKAHSTAHFVIVGPRHPSVSDEEIRSLIDALNIENNVTFTGRVSDEELARWYRRSTIFVLPSYYEAFGLVAAEAMVFGLPVVATTAGALPEVVEDGVTGLLVAPGDAKVLADAIIKLLENEKLRKGMGRKGRERAIRLFDVERMTNRTLEVYRKLCQDRS